MESPSDEAVCWPALTFSLRMNWQSTSSSSTNPAFSVAWQWVIGGSPACALNQCIRGRRCLQYIPSVRPNRVSHETTCCFHWWWTQSLSRYLLNPTVNARQVLLYCNIPASYSSPLRASKEMPPSTIKSIATPMFTGFSRVTRLFEGVISTSPRSRSPSRPPAMRGPPSSFEMGGTAAASEGTKEERRYIEATVQEKGW